MKKYLAILLALAMVFAFAACGAKSEDETTTAAETETTVEDTTAAPADDTTAAPEATDATEATEATEVEETSAEEAKAPETVEEVLACYNAARKATAEKGAPKGHQTMKLDGDITGDGAIGAILKVLSPAAKSALERNSKDTDWIPAADHDDIKPEDVKSATAKLNKDGSISVDIQLKDQTDGPEGGKGPVERGVSTLGAIETALNELGAEITSGRDTVTLTYTNAYVKATIKDGVITGGTWHYLVKVKIVDAKAKLGITANLKNLKANIDYTVAI